MPSASPTFEPTIKPTQNPTITLSSDEIIARNSIILWSDCTNIPTGWTLCDGSSGTPDLSGKFIIGAGNGFDENTTGGNMNHNHLISTSGTVMSHTLTENEMPYHSHRADTEFKYFVRIRADGCGTERGTDCDFGTTQFDLQYVGEELYKGGNQGHTHGLSVASSSDLQSNLPPYHVLCYIMKTDTQYWTNGQ